MPPKAQPSRSASKPSKSKTHAPTPGCDKCVARGVECLGYGAQPFLWVQPKPLRASEPLDRGTDDTTAGRGDEQPKKRGRPRLVLMPNPEDRSTDQLAVELRQPPKPSAQWIIVQGPNSRRRSKEGRPGCPRPRVGLDPLDYKNHKLTLDCLDYFNHVVCPDMVLLDTATNPLRAPLEYWRYFPDVVLDIIVSASLTHQAIRSQAHMLSRETDRNGLVPIKKHRMGSFNGPSLPVIYKHYQRILKAVNQELSKTESRHGDLALGVIVTLMRIEIQQSAFGAWPVHLEAARAIIAQRGGFNELAAKCNFYSREDLVNFMLVDIMNSVMTPSYQMDNRSAGQTDYIAHLYTVYRDGRDSDFPCPARLLEAIIHTNHARALSRKGALDSALDDLAGQVFTNIASFNAADWTKQHVRELLSPSISAASSPSSDDTARDSSDEQLQTEERAALESLLDAAVESVHDMCTDLTKAIQYAVLLYCIRTLHMDRASPSGITTTHMAPVSLSADMSIDVESAHKSALDMLLAALHRLWALETKAKNWCGKLSFWPLFVAGMEIDPGPDSEADRDFICDALRKLVYYLGDLSPLDAVSVLQLIWRKTAVDGCGGQRFSWDERILMPGLRGLFFF
ncbi:extracellular membrane protein, CFEM domain-containingprotein [Purpureocillium lavendulum]|uniref:Extracellular membrane protein, CFEM domain-containingprotein n=1 Tax=Purpureocillium lavendulum TaxID=1247861 RepID=A0AB34FX64_9HYPO|nr:extracellular membrane protein, CFEM domain-containingprotein [Purpureocillium lavendulum]